MAARDPSLAELMRHVATGRAEPDAVSRFQGYINRARAMDVVSVRRPTTYEPLPPPKGTMLAFEFDENANDRFLLPKKSILEILPSGEILWSFLHLSEPVSVEKQEAGQKSSDDSKSQPSVEVKKQDDIKKEVQDDSESSRMDKPQTESSSQAQEPKQDTKEGVKQEPTEQLRPGQEPWKASELTWTPVTLVLREIPLRIASVIEKCVSKPKKTQEYMKDIMARGERAHPYHVWYQVEKGDSLVLDEIRRSQPPVLHPPPQRKAAAASRARRPPVRRTQYPPVPAQLPQQSQRQDIQKQPQEAEEKTQASSSQPVVERPKLNLPDPDKIQLPPGASLPPLPSSLKGIVQQPKPS